MEFVGEPGVDTGGPSREFWSLLCKEIASEYCRGQPGKLVFERNTQALQVSNGASIMNIMSISQGPILMTPFFIFYHIRLIFTVLEH